MKKLICKLFGHDPVIQNAAVQRPGLCYSKLTPAKIIGNMLCRRCGEKFTRTYRTDVVLQLPRTMEEFE